MGNQLIKRIATLLLGVGLVGLGVLFFLAPEQSLVSQMLTRYWPVFLILAGGVRFVGYLIDRQPKSPVGAIMIMAAGGIMLSARLLGHTSFLTILAKYWFWVLLAFLLGRILRQYLHRIEDGPRRSAFSPGAILVMILITGGGLLAGLTSRNSQIFQGLNARIEKFGEMRGYLLREKIAIEDEPPRLLPVAANARLSFYDIRGEIEIDSTAQAQASIQLIKHIGAEDEAMARNFAANIHLRIDSQNGNHRIGILAPDPSILAGVTLIVMVPRNLVIGIDARNVTGRVKLTSLRGDHSFRDCNGLEVKGNVGRVEAENPIKQLELTDIQGEIALRNMRGSLLLAEIRGAISLNTNGGSATIQNASGPIRIQADNSRITLNEIGTDAFAKANQQVVEVEKAANGRLDLGRIRGGVSIAASRTRIEAEGITGDLTITNSQERILARRINGALRIKAGDASVESDEIRGAAVIEASRGITIRNFHGSLILKSESGAIEAETDEKLSGDLQATSDRGRIRVSLPEDAGFQLDAQTTRGNVRMSGFSQFTLERDDPALKTGYNLARPAPRVSLRLGRGDIQLQSSGLAMASARAEGATP
ncbi:MAG: DUF4097 family beta strand repeat-containing protein [Blastocatellia bacterium]